MISTGQRGPDALGNRFFQRKRRLVVDCGNSTVKILLAEKRRRGVALLHALTIDLKEEGLINEEEIGRHLARVLDAFDEVPVATIIRQSSTISQLMDMGRKWPYNVKRAIREETSNLSGLSDKSIIYDFAPLRPFGRFKAPYWVTIARENEVEEQLELLQHSGRRISAVSTPANCLVNAFVDLCSEEKEGILVDIGESSTTVVLMENGQGIFATNVALGAEHFTEAIAQDERCDYEQAEALKEKRDFFAAGVPGPALVRVLERWREEIDGVVLEWSREEGIELERYRVFPCWLSGGGTRQPGLAAYLAREWNHEIRWWPEFPSHLRDASPSDFVIAYGAALSVFGRGTCSVNLLPADLRRERRLESGVHTLYWVGGVAMVSALILMIRVAGGLSEEIESNRHQLERYREALELVETVDARRNERMETYRAVVPFLHAAKTSRDFLETLTNLREIGDDELYWFVLFADETSYFGDGSGPASIHLPDPGPLVTLEDLANERRGFIAELCVPGEDEMAMTSPLGDVVNRLRSASLLLSVDKLPSGQRRTLVRDAATIPEHTFALTLELEPFGHSVSETAESHWRRTPRFFSRP